jgi:serine/threonine protein kinase
VTAAEIHWRNPGWARSIKSLNASGIVFCDHLTFGAHLSDPMSVAEVPRCAHTKGHVHRDVKTASVLIDVKGKTLQAPCP